MGNDNRLHVYLSCCYISHHHGDGLVKTPGAAVSRETLLRTAWGYQDLGETRTVDVHIQRLRRKLGKSCIETVYKTGYKLKMA